eukprot:UN16265
MLLLEYGELNQIHQFESFWNEIILLYSSKVGLSVLENRSGEKAGKL